jgi:hypothetical protein
VNLDLPEAIEAVWLFGSASRRTDRPESDLDVLVVTSNPEECVDETALMEAFCLPRVPDVSCYTRSGIDHIIEPPSLFAWHLRLEGTPLLDRGQWLTERLERLRPYTSHAKELDLLEQLQQDTYQSLDQDGRSVVFDAAVLATVARNAALLLSDVSGHPDFSPFAPIALRTHPVAPFPLTPSDYLRLRQCRLAVERGLDIPALSRDELLGQLNSLSRWLNRLRDCLPRGGCHVEASVSGSN